MSAAIRSKSRPTAASRRPRRIFAAVFMITMLASIGLPMLNNFIGEYLVLQGAAHGRISAGACTPQSA